ncbi:MAG: hypothetical protein LQ337_005431 [Flavoplaca oasis]|nr:MAG: hypothetical protein LQ337_005431 [Flavoplaca oasis]
MLQHRDHGGMKRGPLPENTTRTSILVAMLTLAIYMSAIVDVKVFAMFKRRNTICFWSLLVVSWGIMSHSLGIILTWFVGSCPWYINTAFASFGWWMMVTGQSLVLYSRLHLVIRSPNVLRSVLIMIIFNFTICQIPTTILTFGSNQPNPGMWLKIYNVYERMQLVVFILQELVISILYIRATFKILLPDDPRDTRMTKKFLIYTNVLCIVLDIAFICQVYSGEWVYKTGTQSLAYAIKLSIEFVVLNKLMDVYRVRGSCVACHRAHSLTRPSVDRRGNPSQKANKATWSGSKPRGIEPLGSFDQEMNHCGDDTIQGTSSSANAGLGSPREVADPANHIVVTTGISTWSESRMDGQEEDK